MTETRLGIIMNGSEHEKGAGAAPLRDATPGHADVETA